MKGGLLIFKVVSVLKSLLTKPKNKDHVSCLSSLVPSHHGIPECDVIRRGEGGGVFANSGFTPGVQGSRFFQVPEPIWRRQLEE